MHFFAILVFYWFFWVDSAWVFLGFWFTVCGWFFGFLSYVFPCYGVCENDEDIFSVGMLRFDWGRLLMNNDEVMIASLKML